jgi:hypothetical protein
MLRNCNCYLIDVQLKNEKMENRRNFRPKCCLTNLTYLGIDMYCTGELITEYLSVFCTGLGSELQMAIPVQ